MLIWSNLKLFLYSILLYTGKNASNGQSYGASENFTRTIEYNQGSVYGNNQQTLNSPSKATNVPPHTHEILIAKYDDDYFQSREVEKNLDSDAKTEEVLFLDLEDGRLEQLRRSPLIASDKNSTNTDFLVTIELENMNSFNVDVWDYINIKSHNRDLNMKKVFNELESSSKRIMKFPDENKLMVLLRDEFKNKFNPCREFDDDTPECNIWYLDYCHDLVLNRYNSGEERVFNYQGKKKVFKDIVTPKNEKKFDSFIRFSEFAQNIKVFLHIEGSGRNDFAIHLYSVVCMLTEEVNQNKKFKKALTKMGYENVSKKINSLYQAIHDVDLLDKIWSTHNTFSPRRTVYKVNREERSIALFLDYSILKEDYTPIFDITNAITVLSFLEKRRQIYDLQDAYIDKDSGKITLYLHLILSFLGSLREK